MFNIQKLKCCFCKCCGICDCSLSTRGSIIAWFNVVCRTVLVICLAILLSESIGGADMIFILLLTGLVYMLISLIFVLLVVVGISQKISCYLLPYLTVGLIELLFIFIIYISGIVYCVTYTENLALYCIIFGGIIIMGIYAGLWLVLEKLYVKVAEEEIKLDRHCGKFKKSLLTLLKYKFQSSSNTLTINNNVF